MKKSSSIVAFFVDISGVLLTDGWSHLSRKLAAKMFSLNLEEMESRHNQVFDTYELGKLTLEEYLSRVVFYRKRSFTRAQFRKFMFVQITEGLGIRGICHTDYKSTCAKLASFGLDTVKTQNTQLENNHGSYTKS